MYEDDHLEAAYEERTELPYDGDDRDFDDVNEFDDRDERDLTDEEMEAQAEQDRDFLLEQFELEDFEQADEYFGHYDSGEF